MWSSRSSSLSSSDKHKLSNAQIVSQSALKTPYYCIYSSTCTVRYSLHVTVFELNLTDVSAAAYDCVGYCCAYVYKR